MRPMKIVFVFSLVLISSVAYSQQTCCSRTVAILPIDGTILALAFGSPIQKDSARSDCHPYSDIHLEGERAWRRIVDEIGSLHGADPDPEAQKVFAEMLDHDYLFRGNLIAIEGADGPGGYTLNMQFFDHHRGEVVKEGSTSWTGTTGYGEDAVRALATTFLPLDELMFDYERIPELATVQPAKDQIEAGERMTVHVRDIVDSKNRPSQPWQRILARADKGKILNGESQGEGYRRFEVGDGAVDLSYRAPDACKKQTETITIY
ncbi:hypothetical protein ACFLQM_02950, partial [Acidobacteriota bacterium]